MKKISIFTIGKVKEDWVLTAIAEYQKRLTGIYSFSWYLSKNDSELEKNIYGLDFKKIIVLDSTGRQFTSVEWSVYLKDQIFEWGASDVVFIIGGPEGYSQKMQNYFQEKKVDRVSFSKFTFTHQMIRIILVEQIYRAHCIEYGLSYHK